MDASPISSRLRAATSCNNTKDWASLIVITPIYRTLQQYLSPKNLLNLSNVNRDLKLNYNYLCSCLYIDRRADDFEFVTRTIDRFPNLLSLNISQQVRNFDFLRHVNLQHLKSIKIDLLSCSDDFISCVPKLLSELVIRMCATTTNAVDPEMVFNNIRKLKGLQKLSIIGEYLDDLKISLINLPESLQYLFIDGISYIADVNMTQLVNLKSLCCRCLCIGTHNLRYFLPSNLETLELVVCFNKISYLNISFLTKLKNLKLSVNEPKINSFPQILEKLYLCNCTRLDILRKLHLINLKIFCYNITYIREINLPSNLEIVDIFNSNRIVNLRLPHLINLKKLHLKKVDGIQFLTLPVSVMETLSLEIVRCDIDNIRINYI